MFSNLFATIVLATAVTQAQNVIQLGLYVINNVQYPTARATSVSSNGFIYATIAAPSDNPFPYSVVFQSVPGGINYLSHRLFP